MIKLIVVLIKQQQKLWLWFKTQEVKKNFPNQNDY